MSGILIVTGVKVLANKVMSLTVKAQDRSVMNVETMTSKVILRDSPRVTFELPSNSPLTLDHEDGLLSVGSLIEGKIIFDVRPSAKPNEQGIVENIVFGEYHVELANDSEHGFIDTRLVSEEYYEGISR